MSGPLIPYVFRDELDRRLIPAEVDSNFRATDQRYLLAQQAAQDAQQAAENVDVREWYYGEGAPSAGLGKDLDYYLQATGEVWQRAGDEWAATGISLAGEGGESAYQIAVDAGFVGTVEQWLASLKGEPGAPGDMTNPMTAAGDMIVAEEYGLPARLPTTVAGRALLTAPDVEAQRLLLGIEEGGGGGQGPRSVVNHGAVATSGSESVDIDVSASDFHLLDMSGANTSGTLTLNFINIPDTAGAHYAWHVRLRRGGRKTVAFNMPVSWSGGSAPALGTATNSYDVLMFYRVGGETVRGMLIDAW